VRALIIGGSGFVGRNLVRYLLSEGAQVAVLDRVTDSTGDFGGPFFQGDSQNPEFVLEVLGAFQPEVVYHLAANSDISAGVADASLDFGDTLMTTISVAQACQRHGVSQIVFASSSAIFGQVDGPIAESMDEFFMPESWYGRAKLASEYVLRSFATANPKTAILITRFPNVVGSLATHGVIFDFVNKLRRNPSELQVLGDGNQDKPYVHVGELVKAIEHFRLRLSSGEVVSVNLGPVDTITVRDIAREVSAALGVAPKIHYENKSIGWVGDIPKYEFDSELMRSAGFDIVLTSRQAVRLAAEELALEIESA